MSDPYAYPTTPPPESGETAHSWPPSPGYLPPEEQRTNGFAIASLVFGIISGILLAVIFGIIALVQIGTTGQKGRGMAIGALAVTGGWVLIGVGRRRRLLGGRTRLGRPQPASR
jgi:hypothetical protein